MWLSQLGKTIQPSDVLFNLATQFQWGLAVAKAVGSGCKQGGRSVEDCFSLNPKISKDGILLGWKEMDSYMRENNLKEQLPQIKDEIITEKAN